MLGAVECGLGLANGGHAGLSVVEHEEHVLELAREGKSGVPEHEEHELARDGKSGVSATQEPAEQDGLLNRSDLDVVVEGADESVSQLELDVEDLTDLVEGKRAQRLPNPSSWRQSSDSDSQKDSHCWSGLWAGC